MKKKKEKLYTITMDVKYWNDSYGTKTLTFQTKEEYDKWWNTPQDEKVYKIIGFRN